MPLRRADDSTYVLGTNMSATGSPVAIRGGEYFFFAEGNLSSSVCQLEILSPSGVTWHPVQVFSGSLVRFTTLPGSQTAISLPPSNIRVALNGGGTPSGINAYLQGLG